eukprot:Lithocolla_globosa_v1_NODE_306_length_4583_cov_45.255300.p2 type:complete len:169 gc:universal NODE_306_length_4583_cov_45.255300:3123-3629(+)
MSNLADDFVFEALSELFLLLLFRSDNFSSSACPSTFTPCKLRTHFSASALKANSTKPKPMESFWFGFFGSFFRDTETLLKRPMLKNTFSRASSLVEKLRFLINTVVLNSSSSCSSISTFFGSLSASILSTLCCTSTLATLARSLSLNAVLNVLSGANSRYNGFSLNFL